MEGGSGDIAGHCRPLSSPSISSSTSQYGYFLVRHYSPVYPDMKDKKVRAFARIFHGVRHHPPRRAQRMDPRRMLNCAGL